MKENASFGVRFVVKIPEKGMGGSGYGENMRIRRKTIYENQMVYESTDSFI